MLPLEIAARNLELGEPDEAEIRDRAAKLPTFFNRIVSCRVTVDMPHRNHQTGPAYVVRVDLTVPGAEFVIRRKPRESLVTAIQDAFDTAERRLRKHAEFRRGEVKLHETQDRAQVSEIYPLAGYGFLETAAGERYFFDERSVVESGFGQLDVGSEVRFVGGDGEKGPQASTVIPVRRVRKASSM